MFKPLTQRSGSAHRSTTSLAKPKGTGLPTYPESSGDVNILEPKLSLAINTKNSILCGDVTQDGGK